MLRSDLTGAHPGPPPRLAVGRGRSGVHGLPLSLADDYILKPMPASPPGVAHGRGPRLAPGLRGARG